VVRLLDDSALALPIANPASTTVAVIEQPYQPEASKMPPAVAEQAPNQ
jgi:hypothetical protein